jgi:hypothetical protein
MSIWLSELAGALHHDTIDSRALRGNVLGDPHVRPLWVYTPPGYEQGDRRYPSVYVIQGYSGQVTMWGNRTPFRQPFIETADQVFAQERAPGCVLVYEYCYLGEFAKAARALRDYDHDILAYWKDFQSRVAFTKEEDMLLVLVLGCTAAFSADPDGTPRLPFDPRSGQIREELWQRWLHWDPIRMIDRYADELRSLNAVWIDAGTRDEWFLDLGAEAFKDGLLRIGVPGEKIAFELFPSKHGGMDWRYPLAVEWLANRLQTD